VSRTLLQIALLMSVLFGSLFVYIYQPVLWKPFELKLKDQMLLLRGEVSADNNIVIIDIDEPSLKQYGQWPWPRDRVALLLQNLADLGIGMVGLDVVFAEPDNSSPKRVMQNLGRSDDDLPDFDVQLAQTIANTPTILGYIFALVDDTIAADVMPPAKAIIVERNKPNQSYLLKAHRPILNLPVMQQAAYSSGYFNTVPDSDGVVRSVPLVMEYDGLLYPALSLEMMRIAFDESRISIEYEDQGVSAVQLGDLRIPTDQFGRIMVNYRGGAYQYDYISAADVINRTVDPARIEGKLALLGTSAAGLLDLRSTPFESVYPGVEVHATVLDNILNQDFIAKPMWVMGVDVLTLFVVIVSLGVALIYLASLWSFTVLAILLAGVWFGHFYLFTQQGLLLHTWMPIVSLVTLFLLGTVINYFYESKQKTLILNRFAKKVSRAVVEELINHSDNLVLEGKEQEITIFFSDIRGFTALSEAMSSPQALIKLLNRYMTPMVDIITAHQGTVDKFIGDAIMAYWNAPVAIEHHADEALKASIEQIFALTRLNQALQVEGIPPINIGIGLNTGLAVVGEMGSSGRSDYTCIGDSVNLASRAEGLCKTYTAHIVLTEFTLQQLAFGDQYLIRFLDKVRVKGKAQPVSVYECLGFKHQAWYLISDAEAALYQQAQTAYHQAWFDQAFDLFNQLQTQYPQPLYTLYLERCEHYLAYPPQDFDGVFTLTSK